MKKNYIAPELTIHLVETQNIIALSLQTGKASGDDALVKGNDWDIFGEGAGDDVADDSFFE